jgi:hypothetical protein
MTTSNPICAENMELMEAEKEADKVVKESYEPTIHEYRNVIKVIEEFIKSKDRIVYGGTALHRLILKKTPNDPIYKEYNTMKSYISDDYYGVLQSKYNNIRNRILNNNT